MRATLCPFTADLAHRRKLMGGKEFLRAEANADAYRRLKSGKTVAPAFEPIFFDPPPLFFAIREKRFKFGMRFPHTPPVGGGIRTRSGFIFCEFRLQRHRSPILGHTPRGGASSNGFFSAFSSPYAHISKTNARRPFPASLYTIYKCYSVLV